MQFMAQHTSLRLLRGRRRSFDAEAAVERAMSVFWSRGYHGTSLPDLLQATKLSRGSLYARFRRQAQSLPARARPLHR